MKENQKILQKKELQNSTEETVNKNLILNIPNSPFHLVRSNEDELFRLALGRFYLTDLTFYDELQALNWIELNMWHVVTMVVGIISELQHDDLFERFSKLLNLNDEVD